jgi:hypothetical protein
VIGQDRNRIVLARLWLFIVGLSLLGLSFAGLVAQAAPNTQESVVQLTTTPTATPQPRWQVYLPLIHNPRPLPSSSTLIDEAVAEGRLTAETALLYKVWAGYGDERLPAAYRGDDSHVMDDPEIISQIRQQWNSLSAETQAALTPFLMPPAYEQSWFGQRQRLAANSSDLTNVPGCGNILGNFWTSLPSAKGTVRVWWLREHPGDEAKARDIVNNMDSEIWADLTGLMQRIPQRDDDETCNGLDAALDIYLTPLGGVKGYTKNFGVGCEFDATYIEIERKLGGRDLLGAVTHELMHAIQWSYDVEAFCVGNYGWLLDATANWAIDYALPANNLEHDYAMRYLRAPHKPLDDDSQERAYGAYLFPFFVEHTLGADKIRLMWEATQNKDESLDVVDGVIGGFNSKWADFITANWNRDPIKHYQNWDSMRHAATPFGEATFTVGLDGQREVEAPLPVKLPRVSAQYYHFQVADPNISLLTFHNGYSYNLTKEDAGLVYGGSPLGLQYIAKDLTQEERKGAIVKALVKIKGQPWKEENWTDLREKSFCLDKASERLEELVLIFGNSEWQDEDRQLEPKGFKPTIRASNMGCWQWKGEIRHREGAFVHPEATYETTAQVTFEHSRDLPGGQTADPNQYIGYYKIVPSASSLAWRAYSGSASGCIASGSGTVGLHDESLIYLFTTQHVLPGDFYWTYRGYGYDDANITQSFNCGSETHTHDGPIGTWFQTPSRPEDNLLTISQDGRKLEGTYRIPSGAYEIVYEISLEAQRQP